MPNFLCKLQLGIQSLGLGSLKPKPTVKPAYRLSQMQLQAGLPEMQQAWKQTSIGLPEHVLEGAVGAQYLEHILAQVRVEGFYVSSLAIFRCGNLKPSDSLLAIQRWAASVGLKVSFNHEHALCFFEES
jgi:hypothetical protein